MLCRRAELAVRLRGCAVAPATQEKGAAARVDAREIRCRGAGRGPCVDATGSGVTQAGGRTTVAPWAARAAQQRLGPVVVRGGGRSSSSGNDRKQLSKESGLVCVGLD